MSSKTKKDKKSDKKEDTKKKVEDVPDPEIDTKGKKITLEPGGKLYFHCLEAREVGKKPAPFFVQLLIDGEKIHETQPTSGDSWQFEDPATLFPVKDDAKLVMVILKDKGLVSNTYKGEIRIETETLYTGYPHDEWFTLRNKEGKDDSKIKGALHLRLLYVGKGKEPRSDEFKYPLHSLILANRLDIFKKKLDEMEEKGHFQEDDKKLTPLLVAAKEGKAGFAKLLVEAGAKIMGEVDTEGRNAVHQAAYYGHPTVIHYLAMQKGVDINKPDNGTLTPLHLAAEQNKADACIALIQRKADVDATNSKGNTPLIHALLVQTGAHHAVKALVERGSDIYTKNNDKLSAWEISQRKDICHSSNNRSAFMTATNVVDAREYEIGEKLTCKQRFVGKNLSTEWQTATQFIVNCKENMKVSFLAYSNTRTAECTKQVGFCVVKGVEKSHNLPSFQPEGIGFGSLKPFEVTLEKEFYYHIITYCTKEELHGDFGVCAFYKKGCPELECREGVDYKYKEIEKGSWKGKFAAGSANFKANPHFSLKVGSKVKDEVEVLVMLRQIQNDVSNIFAEGGERIVPTKYYVGFYIYDADVTTELDKTGAWINSFDVYHRIKMKPGKSVVVIPSTRKEGEQVDFELHAYCDKEIELKNISK